MKELSDSIETLEAIMHAADEALYLVKKKQTDAKGIKKPAPKPQAGFPKSYFDSEEVTRTICTFQLFNRVRLNR